jgi:hypothetical protein
VTYRQVPQRWRLVAQLSTLLVTAAIGVSIAFTPPKIDAKLSIIEQAMSVAVWAWIMFIFGLTGFITESILAYKNSMNKYSLIAVSICHTICMSVLIGYSLSAAASLIRTGHWYAFSGPALGIYLSLMHYVYIKRRYTDPSLIIASMDNG